MIRSAVAGHVRSEQDARDPRCLGGGVERGVEQCGLRRILGQRPGLSLFQVLIRAANQGPNRDQAVVQLPVVDQSAGIGDRVSRDSLDLAFEISDFPGALAHGRRDIARSC